MKTIILNESELGKMCAEKIDSRIGTKLYFEDYPEKDCDIEVSFGIRWNVISEQEVDRCSGLVFFDGESRIDITIFGLAAFRNGDPEEILFSEEALKEQIELNI